MKKFYDFLAQSRYSIAGMERFLYGEQGLEDMGLANFKLLAVRGYNDLRKHCFGLVRNYDEDSAYGRFMRDRSLTIEDLQKMFVTSKELPNDCSKALLIEAYGKLARGVRQLPARKILKIYGTKDKNKEHIVDFVVDVDLFQFFNSLFADAVKDQREVITEFNKGNGKGMGFEPTTASKEALKEIDKLFAKVTRDYNEKVLDDKNGVRQVYNAVYEYIDTLEKMGIVQGVKNRAEFAGSKYAPVRVDFGKVGSMGE